MSVSPLPATPSSARPRPIRAVSAWLGGRSRLGLVVMALIVGVGAGLGAAGFRELIFFITWLVTGHQQFGQQ
jgi:CIC family chloride channel protein